ncbi:MAG: hypothetical protein PHW60_03510 [Kiritimatiellae bacterium]|nr:hypothetical protein [Kiritimatiellia bacterium]
MSKQSSNRSHMRFFGTTRETALLERSKELKETCNILSGARVYLSGPMDFVASRAREKKFGWRNRIGEFLRRHDTVVYDPWSKPTVIGMPYYGKEDEFTLAKREKWTFGSREKDHRTREEVGEEFWATVHIDLRMTDMCDFVIAYCPTNVYSVGTVHEIVMARLQQKPVLLVSPRITFPAYDELRDHLKNTGDSTAINLLNRMEQEIPIRPNSKGAPSMWYAALLRPDYFFDGFGFAEFAPTFGWKASTFEDQEKKKRPKRPLLRYLKDLNREIPKTYDHAQDKWVENPDWLILDSNVRSKKRRSRKKE